MVNVKKAQRNWGKRHRLAHSWWHPTQLPCRYLLSYSSGCSTRREVGRSSTNYHRPNWQRFTNVSIDLLGYLYSRSARVLEKNCLSACLSICDNQLLRNLRF